MAGKRPVPIPTDGLPESGKGRAGKIETPSKDKGFYRHELKYFINETGRVELRKRLQLTMDRDKFIGKDGSYHVRSLYFDDPFNSAAQEKLAGVEERKKYRIRIYNLRDDQIKLECKEKQGSYIRKRSEDISRFAAESLIAGRGIPLPEQKGPLCREMHMLCVSAGYRPAVIVDYRREPFVAAFQNVRITMDRTIQCGLDTNLFDFNMPVGLVLDQGISILEVKYNEHLPPYYRDLIGGTRGQRSAASKYTLCRQYRDV